MYDLIGDIHGCAETLAALLERLGYPQRDGVHAHPARRVIFLVDFIDRGLLQREVIDIVRPMIKSGRVLAVMGNHEFNAIAYATPRADGGGHLRPHDEKNRRQHAAFLDAWAEDPAGYRELIDWFRTLPLWLDLGRLRVVHACWDTNFIERIARTQAGEAALSDELLRDASTPGHWAFEAVETLLKGREIPLPPGHAFHDKDGNLRHRIRVRWWDRDVDTYRGAFLGPPAALTHIPDDPIEGDHLIEYPADAPPLFIGHYWMEGRPAPLAPNIACLDYSVARPGGHLVAYRWDGEESLDRTRFVVQRRLEAD
ncbi:metallophosphoesterase [Thiohalobacter sp.]|uniref:metallophosphoesterase n=1 Tax=Thiohalobacter sp. TaxID=2025948 RepID=UPI002628BBD4|nr:metallophosphoesterase [Thiohalobacter sp.]